MARLDELVGFLDAELRTSEVPDSEAALNGLQLENSGTVSRIAAAVDYSNQTIEGAVAAGATLLIVHHGMYWRGREALIGINLARLRSALAGDLAVYSSHIPLDLHPELGNNVLLARELGLRADGSFGRYRDVEIGVTGTDERDTVELFARLKAFSARFGTAAVCTKIERGHRTRRWAIITGAGASPESLAEARERGVDALIVGEGPHHTAVEAMERGPVVMYGGHYATETLGVQALAARASERFDVPWTFIDAPTGL
jgi:dinuclear metal center YbgI/SA1388 family protein